MKIKKITKKFTKENIDEILRVYKHSFDGRAFWKKENFLRSLDSKWKLSVGIYDFSGVYGLLYASKYSSDSAHIHMIFVHPIIQGFNFGTALLEGLFTRCKKCGIKYITVELKCSEGRLYKFYEKCGFEDMGFYELKNYLELKNRDINLYIPANKTNNYVLRKTLQ